MQSRSEGLLFISVREVLKRLCDEQVLLLYPDKSYRFTPQAREILNDWLKR
ncbi:hypothetical protein [Pseudomonas sp. 20P_3.2_Bac5]|uniref:hypothetical protein n=1 Tax=unclassified Pseudomonas TaxID=196821 RepID=UPI003965B7C8